MLREEQNKQNSQYSANYIMFKNRQNLTLWYKDKHIHIKAVHKSKKMIPIKSMD